MVQEIETLRARLEALSLDADSPVDTLSVALDAFEALLAASRASQDRSAALFAPFAFAAMAAAEGRSLLLTAPSLPQAHGPAAGHAACVQTDLDVAADALAGLAGALSERLWAAAHRARNPGDHAACRDAAREAARIHELLARDD